MNTIGKLRNLPYLQNMNLILSTNIRSYLQSLNSKKVVIGFSWWPDSVATYALISDYYSSQNRNIDDIFLAHYNHWVRKESIEEEAYLKKNIHNLIIWTYQWISKKEMELRNARHIFFQDCMKKARTKVLILGHNLTDRLETTIMNIQRGAWANGIANMNMVDNKEYLLSSTYTIIRPLLPYPKHHITEFCNNRKLHYFIDHSNEDSSTSERNYIRKEYIKPLESGDKKNIEWWWQLNQSKLSYSDLGDMESLFDQYLQEKDIRDGIRRRYAVYFDNPILLKPIPINIPSYAWFDYIYKLDNSIGEHECIYILKWIWEYNNISSSYIAWLLRFIRESSSGYKIIWKWKLYNCHNSLYLVLENKLFNPWQVLQFWLQYKNDIVRLVDSEKDIYKGKPINKRFINNKIPIFMRHLTPVDQQWNYNDNLIQHERLNVKL